MELAPHTQKSTIAWFKLSEFVARKEKERALAALRLLSHSIPGSACTFQVQADLLYAFHDPKAYDLYDQAAQAYAAEGHIVQAALLYEHLGLLLHNIMYWHKALSLYQQTGLEENRARCALQLSRLLLQQQKYADIDTLLESVLLSQKLRGWVIMHLLLYCVDLVELNNPHLQYWMRELIDCIQPGPELNGFLVRVAVKSPSFHEYMMQQLQQ